MAPMPPEVQHSDITNWSLCQQNERLKLQVEELERDKADLRLKLQVAFERIAKQSELLTKRSCK